MVDDALVDALHRKVNHLHDRVERLEEENEDLREKVSMMSMVVNPNPATSLDELTRDRKVFRIRKNLVEQAAQSNGLAKMDYKEVRWLFDGDISRGHAYDLMRLAEGLDGFDYQTDPEHRITVKLDGVNDMTLIHVANTAQAES